MMKILNLLKYYKIQCCLAKRILNTFFFLIFSVNLVFNFSHYVYLNCFRITSEITAEMIQQSFRPLLNK